MLDTLNVMVRSILGGAGTFMATSELLDGVDHPWVLVVGMAMVLAGCPYDAAFGQVKPTLQELTQRSIELEQETGLVFDVFGAPEEQRHFMWPGYWEYDRFPGGQVVSPLTVRSEGGSIWIPLRAYTYLDALEFLERAEREQKRQALRDKRLDLKLQAQESQKFRYAKAKKRKNPHYNPYSDYYNPYTPYQ